MLRLTAAVIGVLFGPLPLATEAPAQPAPAADRGSLAARCVEAARVGEAAFDLPEGLLVAVAIVESALHPYAVGSADESRYPPSVAEARRAARALGGARAVSGGCFQVNIRVHARTAPDWVFDAAGSALFAARLLAELRDRHGGFAAALAAYNGAPPGSASGRAYACRVRAALAEVAPASVAAIRGPCPAGAAIRAKAASLLALAGFDEVQLAEAAAPR